MLLLRPGDALLALVVWPALALAAANHVAGALKAVPPASPSHPNVNPAARCDAPVSVVVERKRIGDEEGEWNAEKRDSLRRKSAFCSLLSSFRIVMSLISHGCCLVRGPGPSRNIIVPITRPKLAHDTLY